MTSIQFSTYSFSLCAHILSMQTYFKIPYKFHLFIKRTGEEKKEGKCLLYINTMKCIRYEVISFKPRQY